MGKRKKKNRREVGRDRYLGWKLSSQMDFGWPLGMGRGRYQVTRESMRDEPLGYHVAGHWGLSSFPASESVSRRVRRDSLVLS